MTDIYERIDALKAEGLRWTEIAKRLTEEFGRPFSDDAVRNAHTRWLRRGKQPPKPGHGAVGEPGRTEEVPQTFEEIVEGAKEKERKRFDEAAYRRLLQEKARTDLMCEVLERAVQRIPAPTIIPVRRKFDPALPTVDAVALSSDWHIGAEIRADETGGLGEYNLEIFHQREKQWQDDILEYLHRQSRISNIRRLHVFKLGDNFDGDGIYRGQKDHLEVDVTEQLFTGLSTFGGTLVEFQNDYDVEVWAKGGNHGRVGMKDENKHHVNWDYIAYRFLERETSQQPKIHWHLDKAWWSIADVLGWRFLLMHGEDIKAWNGLPHYGIDRAFARYIQMGLVFEYMAIGHFHQPAEFDAPIGEKIVNGAAPGPSFYSLKKLNTGSRPSQLLFGVTAEQGLYWRHTVYLDDAQPRRRTA